MVAANFERCLANVLVSEGGFSNDPHDPGGATMRGVIQGEYNVYRTAHGLSLRSVRYINDGEMRDIYRSQYWDKINGDELPAGLDYCVFDAAVNSGVSRALHWLDNIDDDNATAADEIVAYCQERLQFLKDLRTWRYFGKGWGERVAKVLSIGKKMAAEASTPAASEPDTVVAGNAPPLQIAAEA